MTCTTFLHSSELNRPLPDAEVQQILDEVRKLSGQDWQVVPLPERRVGIFRRKTETYYGVYVYVGGMGPWQQINFWNPDSRSSINLYVPLETVAAYLLGVLAGLWKKEAKTEDLDPTTEDPALLWAEIIRLRDKIQGPDGFDTWQDAAVAERVRRVAAEKELRKLKENDSTNPVPKT